MRVRRKALGIF